MTRSLHYTPFLPEVMADPYPFYRRLRDEDPVYYISEYDGWAIARFEDVWQAARQPDVFVNARGTTAPQALSKIVASATDRRTTRLTIQALGDVGNT